MPAVSCYHSLTVALCDAESEESFVEVGDVFFQVFLGFFVDPLFEVDEVEGVGVFYFFELEPLEEVGEVVGDFFAVEDAVDHVAAEEPHLDFVAGVGVDALVLVDVLEDVGGGGAVGELQVVETLLLDAQPVPLLEVLDRHVRQHVPHLVVDVFEHQVRLHVLLLESAQKDSILGGLRALHPLLLLNVRVRQHLRHLLAGQVSQEGVGVEELNFEEVVLGGQSLRIGEVG